MPESEALANFAATGATLVLHLAITRIRELAAELGEHYGTDCPVVVAHRISQPAELILRGTLADIADKAHGLLPPAVIVVGEVVRLREQLDWYAPPASEAEA